MVSYKEADLTIISVNIMHIENKMIRAVKPNSAKYTDFQLGYI